MSQLDLMQTLMEATPAAIAVFDKQMKYLLVSDSWLSDHDMEGQNLIGKSHYDILPEIPEHWKEIHQACLNGETRKCNRDEFTRANGKHEYLKWEVRPWYVDEGQIGGIVVFTEFITELVEAEKRLKQQIQFQEMLLQNLPEFAAFLFDTDMRFLLVDGSALRKANYDPSFMHGKLMKETVDEEGYTALYPQYTRILQGETIFFRRQPPHLNRIYHNYGSPVFDDNGQVIAGIIVSQDVTQLDEDRKLREFQESRFKAIFNNTFQFTGFMDTNGILLEANETALAFAGLREEDVIGKPFWEARWWSLSSETQEQLKDGIQRAAQGEFVRYDADVVGGDDVVITIDFSIKPVLNTVGEVIQLIPEGRNITEEVMLREELKRSNSELQNFAYIASHDLQEPLRMVTSFLDLLKVEYGGQLSDEADQYIDFAVDGAQRMKQLIQDLLTYSRISTQGGNFTQINLNLILQYALTDLSLKIQETDAQIHYGENLPTIQGDESQLIRLFVNLIGNAIKFQKSDQQPIINICVEKTDTYWRFAVQDNGIGIDPTFHNKIFTIFKRLHTRTQYIGTGIGLAVCKKIIERHNGKMWVESVKDEGSTFYFTLPTPKEENLS